MVQRADAELIGYLADHHSQARLVLRDVSDTDTALAALTKAAAAVWSLPHPDEPGCALPNWCEAALEDGHAVLHMDAKDGAGQIDQIAAAMLGAIEEAGAGGRLEPFPRQVPAPEEYAGAAPAGDPAAGGDASSPPASAGRRRRQVRPRVKEVAPGDLGLTADERGLLRQEGLRSMIGPVVTPRTLAGYETATAMRSVRHASKAAGRRREKDRRSDGTPPLWPLREHRHGLTLADLCTRMPETYERLAPVFDELERTGQLVRWRDEHDSIRLRLTDRGQRAMDERLREQADDNRFLVEDIPAERVTVVRHVCVQAAVNGERLEERPRSEPSPAASDPAGWQVERDEQDRLYVTGVREFFGPLEPDTLLANETVYMLGAAMRALPRAVPAGVGAMPLWWLHGCPEGHGMPRSAIEEALGREGARAVEELGRAGVVSETEAGESAGEYAGTAVCRLTEKGRQLMSERVRVLEGEVDAAFEGVSLEDLAQARDGCWRIALNRLAAEVI